MRTITVSIGQCVPWPPAPQQLAQVDDLLRRNIVIVYRARSGRIKRPRVSVVKLAALLAKDQRAGSSGHSPLLPIDNPLGRGALKRSKTFALPEIEVAA